MQVDPGAEGASTATARFSAVSGDANVELVQQRRAGDAFGELALMCVIALQCPSPLTAS